MIRNLLAELAKWLNGQRGLVMQTQGLTKLFSDLHTHAVAHVTPRPQYWEGSDLTQFIFLCDLKSDF